MTVTFLLTSLIVVLSPGTGALYTVAAALGRGPRAAAFAAVGCTLGIVPQLVLATAGLAAVLRGDGVLFQALRWVGVAYLAYLAVATARDRSGLTVTAAAEPVPPWRVLGSGALVNVLNPKLAIFFVGFLPGFVPDGAPGAVARMLLLGGVFMGLTLVVFLGYGGCAAALRTRVLTRPRVQRALRWTFAGCFLGLAALLAVAA